MHVGRVSLAGTAFATMPVAARLAAAVAIALLALGIAWLVHATGGVRLAYAHLMYVPVLLAAILFGLAGGLAAGLAGGLLLGPLMPLDTATGEMQQPLNWIYRTGFFTLVGVLVGIWAQLFRRHLRQLRWLHEHHEGTGLLNLTGLTRRIEAMIGSGEGPRLALAVTQLNALAEIQNTFGPAFGMRVLDRVVERAKAVAPPGALVALIQPDRLAAVMERRAADPITPAMLEAASADSYIVDGLPIHVEASTGVAYFPEHAATAEELLQKASIAMHAAAARRASVKLYDPASDRTSRENLILLGMLPDATVRGELEVWHQAKLAIASGTIAGTEALVRWNHPDRGMVSPERFIPQVEETTLINPVTEVVIARALADAGAWRAAGYDMRVAINLSVRNLLSRTLVEVLDHHCRSNRLRPSEVELEITETAVMADPKNCARLIALLRNRGYGVSVDDFGAGQTSLAYLHKLRVSALKIDQTFIRTLATDPGNQTIVRAIVQLAKALGLQTVAEGVEDAESLALLREWGCDYAQGYFVHRPAPAPEVTLMLAEQHRELASAAGNVRRL